MTRYRILVADDQVLTQEGLRRLLEGQYDVVGAVSDGRALVEAAFHLKPDLIITNVAMPILGGIEAARQIRKRLPRVKALFLTVNANPTYLREALTVGAAGYVLKSSTREEILGAVATVLAGRKHISRGIVGEDFDLLTWQEGKARSRPMLTSRERQVLQLLAEGRTAREVAAVLKVSAKTVAFHRHNFKRKLGLRKTIEIIKRAVDDALI